MRRVFIIRKDLHLTSGKLAAMVSHCAESYWLNLIRKGMIKTDHNYSVKFDLDNGIVDGYINDIITKTICEARNLNQLDKAKVVADELGLIEGVDYGYIDDACKTELTPEFTDENGHGRCRVGMWFKPLNDEDAHKISKKFPLYKD